MFHYFSPLIKIRRISKPDIVWQNQIVYLLHKCSCKLVAYYLYLFHYKCKSKRSIQFTIHFFFAKRKKNRVNEFIHEITLPSYRENAIPSWYIECALNVSHNFNFQRITTIFGWMKHFELI